MMTWPECAGQASKGSGPGSRVGLGCSSFETRLRRGHLKIATLGCARLTNFGSSRINGLTGYVTNNKRRRCLACADILADAYWRACSRTSSGSDTLL